MQDLIQLTLYVELYGGVGHPHHVLCDAGQLKVVVISADVEESQVDGVDVGPVYIWLDKEGEPQKKKVDVYLCEWYIKHIQQPFKVHSWLIKWNRSEGVHTPTETKWFLAFTFR